MLSVLLFMDGFLNGHHGDWPCQLYMFCLAELYFVVFVLSLYYLHLVIMWSGKLIR